MRISTTTVDSFRLLKGQDWMDEERFIAQIKGEEVWDTRKRDLGRSFHAILEDPEAHVAEGGYRAGEFFWPTAVMGPCLSKFDARGVPELKETKVYRVAGKDVTVVGQVDRLIGRWVHEYKTKWSGFDFDSYHSSVQWRFYADIFQPMGVEYTVFCLADQKGGIELRSIERFSLFPHPGIAAECQAWVEEFVGWIHSRGLERYFRDRREAA